MKCSIIKIGGTLIEDEEQLTRLCGKLSALPRPFVVVHGGGTFAGHLAGRLGIPCQVIDGRRVTDRDTLEITVMAYAGWVNKTLVARLQAHGVNACGLSGCDTNLIRAHKRVRQDVDWGYVGDVEGVNETSLGLLLQSGIIPVISPITHDGEGGLLNSNADGIAAAVAGALCERYETELIYCFDKRGVLKDARDQRSVISRMNPEMYETYKQNGTIHSGMIPKLDNAFKSVRSGVGTVRLVHPDELDNPAAGTSIILK